MQKEFRNAGGGGETKTKQEKAYSLSSLCESKSGEWIVWKQPEQADLFYATWDTIACLKSRNIPHGDKPITANPTWESA